jgi:two-component system nitrogen regulation response regulator GlnG
MTPESRALLQSYSWPGNVRELANIIQKALIFSRGYPIRPEEISQAIGAESAIKIAQEKDAMALIRQWIRQDLINKAEENIFDALIDRFASLIIQEALDLTGGNRSQAARLLSLSRPTLQAKIDKYRLKVETSVTTEGA